MSTTYDLSGRRRATTRTWLALGAAAAAVLVLLVMIAVACNPTSDREPAALDTPTPAPTATADEDAGAGGAPGDQQDSSSGAGAGDGSGDGSGDGPGGDGPGGDGPGPVDLAAKDCKPFDPEGLTTSTEGNDWALRSGATTMQLFASQLDAEDAMKIARNWRQMCFIGLGNDRPDPYRYIVHYWEEPSGLPFGLAPSKFDCISYDPPNLGISEHAGSWWLLDGPAELLPLDNRADAERAKLVASEFTQLCFVGLGNDRPDHDRYTMTYWRP
jgi:hypothetical protein